MNGFQENSKPPAEFYDEVGGGYDLMINWDVRLKNESPFFRRLFEENNVKSILDCACGPARHAIEFAKGGYEVSGCDISPEMVRLGKEAALRAGVAVNLFEAGLTEVAQKAGKKKFDAILCIGNSLPHLLTQRELERAMRSIKRVLTTNGIFITQIRNYDRILRENLRFMPPTSSQKEGIEYLFFRMLDIYGHRRVDFHIIQFVRESGKWNYAVHTTRLRPILKENMEAALEHAGFQKVDYYGDYSFTPFEKRKTLDLISVAR